MTTMRRPCPGDVDDAMRAIARWPRDGQPVPLHVGDLGWVRRLGADPLAAAVRTWHRDGAVVSAGLLDGPVIRLAVDPVLDGDPDLVHEVQADLDDLGGASPRPTSRCVRGRRCTTG